VEAAEPTPGIATLLEVVAHAEAGRLALVGAVDGERVVPGGGDRGFDAGPVVLRVGPGPGVHGQPFAVCIEDDAVEVQVTVRPGVGAALERELDGLAGPV